MWGKCFDLSELRAMASNLVAMASNLVELASNLLAMASISFVRCFCPDIPARLSLDLCERRAMASNLIMIDGLHATLRNLLN